MQQAFRFAAFYAATSIFCYSQEVPGAKPPEVVSDRPDYTESSEVIRRGDVQWESGFSWEGSGGVRSSLFGAPLARIGLGKRLELRLSSDGMASERGERGRLRGISDPAVGFKWKIWDERGWLPAFGIIPAVSMPWGKREFSSGHHDPSVKLTWAKDGPVGFALSGNMNFASLSDETGRMSQQAATLSVGHDLGKGFAGYWEVYSFSREEREGPRVTVFQMGLTHGVGESAQLDVSVARRMTSAGPDWVVSTGFVIRHSLGFSGTR